MSLPVGRRLQLHSFILLVFLPLLAFAKDVPEFLFGPEFTFGITMNNGDPEMFKYSLRDSFYRALRTRMRNHLVDGQPAGQKFTEEGPIWTSPNGWQFYLTVDMGVIEVKMLPMTAAAFRHFSGNIQDAIFVSAANENIFPALFTGGGHINIGLTELADHPLLLRNFIVDYFNHAELALGIMNYDSQNALPLLLQDSRTQNRVLSIIREWDAAGVKIDFNRTEVFVRRLHFALSDRNDDFVAAWSRDYTRPRGKATALNLSHTVGLNSAALRLEVRAVRPQASIDVWVRQIELLQKRLGYLATLKKPVPFKPMVEIRHPVRATGEHKLVPPVNPQAALRAFYIYVTESGEKWRDHKDYIWPEWITRGEVDKFEDSQWFQEHEAGSRSCAQWLQPAS